ncbi:MAG: hypothetical protein Q4B27_01305 [Candidatus Saccharibacteria bacterium]|nr:hypothetical protein [Candidatus Saccharibacteria bacterium]
MTEQRPPSIKNHYSERSMRPADVLYYDKEIARRPRILEPPVGDNPYGQEMLVGGVDGTQIDVVREAALLPQPDESVVYTMYDAQSPYALTVSMRHNRALLYLCDESDSGPIPRKAEGYALKMSLVDISHLADMRFITLGEPVVSLPDPRNHRAALTITPDAIGVFGAGTAVDDGSNETQPAQSDASPYSMNVMNILHPQLVQYEVARQRYNHAKERQDNPLRPRTLDQLGYVAYGRSGWI